MDERLLSLYNSELRHLRDMTGEFAREYPERYVAYLCHRYLEIVAAQCGYRTDAARGVWKAPAGLEATVSGVSGLTVKLTDGENGQLNPIAVNCLRNFPNFGTVVWGSRTLDGADQLASEWKYVPVRRVALFIEESLYRGTQWVVFEPNDEPLWAQVRLNIGAFMHNLFRQGAFQGKTPNEAYFVKCDKETTTQNDINLGIVNIVVGFAPLKPAEFVIIKIQQIAGEIAT
jgi:phage tail sheath protein FI